MRLGGGTILCQNPSPLQLTSCFLKISTFKVSTLNGHYVLLLEAHRNIFKIFPFFWLQKWSEMDLTKPKKT